MAVLLNLKVDLIFEPNTHETLFLECTVDDWKRGSCLSPMILSVAQEGQR